MVDIRLAQAAAITVVAVSVAACTAQDRYYAARNDNLRECDQKLSEVERERCRERVVPASYEEYQRLRATVPGQAERKTPETQP